MLATSKALQDRLLEILRRHLREEDASVSDLELVSRVWSLWPPA